MKLIAFTFVACVSFGAAAVAQQGQAPAGNIENGKKHFTSDGCYQCHGATADGAVLTGPRLSRTALPYDAFLMQLRKPSAEMPPYEKAIVSDAVAADIYAFVKSLPASPDAESLPLLMNMGVR